VYLGFLEDMDHDVDTAAVDLCERAEALNAEMRYRDALEVVTEAAGQDGRTPELDLVRVDSLVGLEQFRDAYDLLGALLEDGGEAVRAQALMLRARVLRRSSRYVDRALESALDAALIAARQGDGETACVAHLEAARGFAGKHCRALAERELEHAREADPEQPLLGSYTAAVLSTSTTGWPRERPWRDDRRRRPPGRARRPVAGLTWSTCSASSTPPTPSWSGSAAAAGRAAPAHPGAAVRRSSAGSTPGQLPELRTSARTPTRCGATRLQPRNHLCTITSTRRAPRSPRSSSWRPSRTTSRSGRAHDPDARPPGAEHRPRKRLHRSPRQAQLKDSLRPGVVRAVPALLRPERP
jgi:hypothetical protein